MGMTLNFRGCPNKFWIWIYQKVSQNHKNKKKSSKCAYIFAMQCSSPFILTNIKQRNRIWILTPNFLAILTGTARNFVKDFQRLRIWNPNFVSNLDNVHMHVSIHIWHHMKSHTFLDCNATRWCDVKTRGEREGLLQDIMMREHDWKIIPGLSR